MPGAFEPEILEILQIGVEGSYASAASADKRLQAVKARFSPKIPTERIMGQGSKSPTGVVVGKEHTEIPISGVAALNDLAYLFSMLLETPTITTPMGGTLTRLWEYEPDTHGADDFSSFTFEKGFSGGTANGRVAGVLADSLELTFTPEKSVDFTGNLFGKEREGGITLTSSPDTIPQIVLDPRGIDVFVADSEGGLSGGQIKPLQAKWSVKDRLGRVFTLDSAEPSFEDAVERAFYPMGQLIVRANSDSEAYLDELRASATKFIQYLWTGANIEGSLFFSLSIVMPFAFENPEEGDNQEAHVHTFDLCGVDNADFDGSVKVSLHTTLTAL